MICFLERGTEKSGFLADCSGRAVKSGFCGSSRSFSRKGILSPIKIKVFVQMFWDRISEGFQICLRLVHKNDWRITFPTRNMILKVFCHTCLRKVRQKCSNCFLRVQTTNLTVFSISFHCWFFVLEANGFKLLAKYFGQCSQNCFRVVKRIALKCF